MRLKSQSGQQFEITQGKPAVLALLALSGDGTPFNLEGATLTTQIMGIHCVGPISYGNSWHTLKPQSLHPGAFTLNLDADDTHPCAAANDKEIILHVAIHGVVTTFRGDKILNVYPSENHEG